MDGANTQRAVRPGNRRRKPKVASDGRVCESPNCRTVISRYNTSDFCHRHRPVRFPRLRGVVSEAS